MTNKFKLIGAVLLVGLIGGANLQASEKELITYEEAVNIVLNKFPNSKIKEVEVDNEKYSPTYEIKFFNDKTKKEIEIDAKTGKIIEEKSKYNKVNKIDFSKIGITMNEARLKAMSLEKDFIFEKIELDNKMGKPVYKVELKQGNSERKIVIDAINGEILNHF